MALARVTFGLPILLLALTGASSAQPIEDRDLPTPEGIAFFEKNVRPLLARRCYGCHHSAQAKPMGGLALDSRAGMLRGGKSGAPSIVAGKPEDSLLITAVRGTNKELKMPAKGEPLEPREIE